MNSPHEGRAIRFLTLGVGWVLTCSLHLYGAERKAPVTAEEEGSAIREFSVKTIAALGRDIHRHDQLAWVATDVLLAKIDRDTYFNEGAAGWVVDVTGKSPVVRFLRVVDDLVEAAYDVEFRNPRKPTLQTPKKRELTASQLAAHQAQQTVMREFVTREETWCGGNPNTVVLPDPEREGLLVYILRPKQTNDAIPVGGHYRATVSADGKTLEQLDRLFASCLTLSRSQGVPQDGEIAALTVTHIVSRTPLETHVFLSLQEKLPFYVVTPDALIWQIYEGKLNVVAQVGE